MNSPYRSSSSPSKFVAVLAALVLAVPIVFAQPGGGGRGGGGGGGGAGGGAGAGGRGGSTPKAPNPLTELKNKYDKNTNGKLDTDELKVIKKENDTQFQELIKFDTSPKNNILEPAELDKWAATKKTATGQGGRGGNAAGGGGQSAGGGAGGGGAGGGGGRSGGGGGGGRGGP